MEPVRICVVGASFAGAILTKQVEKYLVPSGLAEITTFERAIHIGDSETSTGLNINSNAMATLRLMDPDLCDEMEANGAPRCEMVALKMSGETLYRVPVCSNDAKEEDNLATYPGLRIRWKDASTCVREKCQNVIYGTQVNSYTIDRETNKISVQVSKVSKDGTNGEEQEYKNFDILIAADGRYSRIRQMAFNQDKPAAPLYADTVCNFRLLVDDDSNDLFEDMQLIYNDAPSTNVVEDAQAREELERDEEFAKCLNSVPRIGIMKMPASKTYAKDSIYIFGNFGIEGTVPDCAKTATGLTALFTPCIGPVSEQCKYIVKKLQENVSRLHWARMQEIPFVFRDPTGLIAFLGDSAHAMYPSLGQGATTAIEDAAVASEELISEIVKCQKNKEQFDARKVTEAIEQRISVRSEYVAQVSRNSAEHLKCGAKDPLENDVMDWTNDTFVQFSAPMDGSFREMMRQLWRGYPKVCFDKFFPLA
eukprot:TRINITY_DN150_c0_g1_i1.p1 TRINITY_DN150_c0_g1~~TRINITY_DN150_c0_g1_i1.p1  ORF type:complete len:479 (-),score=105.95 TRINITY_DN150_c0_g1_i1:67-1503(-)